MITITNIKAGDTLGIYNKFNIFDINTLISPIVRDMENLGDPKGGWDKFQHIGSCIISNNVLSIGEAVEPAYHVITIEEKFKGRNQSDFIIYRPRFKFDINTYTKAIQSFIGKKYSIGDLVAEAIKEITERLGSEIWVGLKKEGKATICSNSGSLAYYYATQGALFKNFYEIDPKDFWVSDLFDKIPVKYSV